jgi:nicotinamidase-related amidase
VRAAVNRFHRVVVLEDCCASVPEEWHRFSTEKILPLIATVTSSEKLIAALRAGSPPE